MEYFQTKNPNLGKFCRALRLEMLVYFLAIWSMFTSILRIVWQRGIPILWSFGIFFPRFGMLNQEKSGNPGPRFGSKEFRSLLWFQVAFISFNRNVYMIQGHKNYGSKR
jgi:hypothetical protein